MGADQYAARLRTGRWFSELDAAFQDALLRAATVRVLRDGEVLFSRGDPPTGLFSVVEGAMRVTSVTEDGRELVLTRFEPPAWFGEIAVFDRLPRTHDCVADGPTVVLHLTLSALDALLTERPTRWRDLGLLIASKLRLAFLAMEDAAVLPPAGRVARRLVLLAEGHGEWRDGTQRVLRLPQEQLASMVGASRQTVNQVLKEFEARGLVRVTYGHIELVDLDGLRALCPTP